VYVCDPVGGRVAVFDADGKPVASLAVPAVLRVAVNPEGTAVYCVSRSELRKVADLQKPHTVWSMPLPKVPGNTPPVFVLDAGGTRPLLWIGCPQQRNYSKYVLWRIEDAGDKPGKPHELSDRGTLGLYSPVHLAADPLRDEIYCREWRESWRGQWFRRFDGRTGERTDLKHRGNEMAVGPAGRLYVRGFHGGSVGTWIQRFEHDGTAAPFGDLAEMPAPARKRAGLWVLGSLRGATAVGIKGFCVAPDGDLYVMRYFSARGGKAPWIQAGYSFPRLPPGVGFLTPLLDQYSGEGRLRRSGVVKYFRQGACGVKVDRAGNLYVADHIKPTDRLYPADLADQLPAVRPGRRMWDWPDGLQNWYLFNCGSLFKFPPAGGRITEAKAGEPGAQLVGSRSGRPRFVKVHGALWQYTGISPVPADTDRGHGGGCVCTNGRFDLDDFGRVYVPDVLRFAVVVLDAEGNRVTEFGRYGNCDTGRNPAEGRITLNWGAFVGCTRDAVYVADNLNRRIVRVVRRYEAEVTRPVQW
jgi:DNA-binding beta-propeller fold protein YncE